MFFIWQDGDGKGLSEFFCNLGHERVAKKNWLMWPGAAELSPKSKPAKLNHR
jgi:hypothetical protein